MRDIIFFPCRYHAAVSHSGYVTLTTPYLDMGGAGEVITAARSLYRGESSDNVLGVMGADFPLRHFYRSDGISLEHFVLKL